HLPRRVLGELPRSHGGDRPRRARPDPAHDRARAVRGHQRHARAPRARRHRRPRGHRLRRMTLVLLLPLLLAMEGTMSGADLDVQARNKQAVRAAFDRWRDGTGSVFDLLAPDARWTIVGNSPVSRTYASRQEFLDAVITPFNARMSRRLVP